MNANLVQNVCRAYGWSQSQLAEKMGYSIQTIRNVSSNPAIMPTSMQKHLETLLHLAKYEGETDMKDFAKQIVDALNSVIEKDILKEEIKEKANQQIKNIYLCCELIEGGSKRHKHLLDVELEKAQKILDNFKVIH